MIVKSKDMTEKSSSILSLSLSSLLSLFEMFTQLLRSSLGRTSPSLFSRSLLSLRAVPAPSFVSPCAPSRFVSVEGGDLRPGNVIERNGRLFEVVDAEKARTGGRGASYNQARTLS